MTTVKTGEYRLPAALIGAENPLPFFKNRERNSDIATDGTLSEDELKYLGWETEFRILPYTMQDNYRRDLNLHTFTSVELESDRYHVVLLPELGARVVSLFDKEQQRELLFKNPKFQPANLSIRNAWFSGGIEWNIGHLGHTFTTCSPVHAARIEDPDGNAGVRIFDYERCKGLFWQIDLYLLDTPVGLTAHVKIINPNNETVPMYWWTNIAVPEKKGGRVIAPADRMIYKLPGKHGFGAKELPLLPSIENLDGTYALNHPISNEFFFQCKETQNPWEVLAYPDGNMFLEYSTAALKARKLFCWGTGQGGRHWQEYLNDSNDYLEIQAGLTPVQSCSIPMPAHSVWQWTQVFGSLKGTPGKLHSETWIEAYSEVSRQLASVEGYRELDAINQSLSEPAGRAPVEMLFCASGWGRLEIERMSSNGIELEELQSVPFPVESLGEQQEAWYSLLKSGTFQCNDENSFTWMVQPEWKELLESLPDAKLDWLGNLHLGVMYMELGDVENAKLFWNRSIELSPNALAYRCLAFCAAQDENLGKAVSLMQEALESADEMLLQRSLAVELLRMLMNQEQWDTIESVYTSLSPEIQTHETIQICYVTALVKLNKFNNVESILDNDFALIREGEISLSNLWNEMWARRIALENSETLSDKHFAEAADRYPPPYRIDFRMI
jgi:tetratricopeptide (TPR) repeat protein